MRIRLVALAALGLLWPFAANAETVGARFASREPKACPSGVGPANGPLTVPLATAFVICSREHATGDEIYLVGGATIQVGRPRPFTRDDTYMHDADPSQPVYAIRGSIVTYQCDQISTIDPNSGQNCRAIAEPNASGFCYGTAFGEWSCFMRDMNNLTNVVKDKLPPPA